LHHVYSKEHLLANPLRRVGFGLASLVFSISAQANLLVPAYFYPSFDPNQSYWDEMTSAASKTAITAIVNPNSGPGLVANSDYTRAINDFRSAGGKVVAYIPTNYGARNQADVLADFASYVSFYPIDGVFLDEMSNQTSTLGYYQAVYGAIKSANANYQVFANPGMQTDEAFLSAADVLVTYENQTHYAAYTPEAWTANYSANHFANLLYNVGNQQEMQADLVQISQNNVGYFYITDDHLTNPNSLNNPWDTLPSYWNAEVQAVSSVPEPTNAALMLIGLGLIGLTQSKRRASAQS
jgi:hypothetical protein